MSQLGSGQRPQLAVHQRQQLLGSCGIALFDLEQDLGNVGHEDQDTADGQAMHHRCHGPATVSPIEGGVASVLQQREKQSHFVILRV
jgi:hypothetical protein